MFEFVEPVSEHSSVQEVWDYAEKWGLRGSGAVAWGIPAVGGLGGSSLTSQPRSQRKTGGRKHLCEPQGVEPLAQPLSTCMTETFHSVLRGHLCRGGLRCGTVLKEKWA